MNVSGTVNQQIMKGIWETELVCPWMEKGSRKNKIYYISRSIRKIRI